VVLCTDEKSQVQARQIFSRRLMSDSHCPTVLGMLCVVLDDQLECRVAHVEAHPPGECGITLQETAQPVDSCGYLGRPQSDRCDV
jgi:hypothetical protein